MNERDIISLISKVRENANSFIIAQMEAWGIKGLVTSHGDILCELFENDKLSMKDLTERIGRDKSTVTVLVDKLLKQGYVEKARDDEDNRIVFVTLTEKGKELKPMFETISKELIATAYNEISQEEKERLIETLTKIKNNFK
ncbi:MarR family transcriptional regulator [Clostridium sp. KNHs205]|jgi:MarR family transcriptional regulator, organic hydroperoxide resistance regulator|uniref:MarR family winged helix-turn-helix transcriptional regulator n=1 Tax=Clostridium sp. KNHs205 TaxID=1449050 RepID=UPI00051B83CB|nr:MarR family transcriptional regulator [Clostridium sp. KNHs205]